MAHLFNTRKKMVDYQSLLGRQWSYGVNDCFSLVRDWFKIQGVQLPEFSRPENLEICDSIFLQQAEAIGFEQVALERRMPGDILIMRLETRTPMHAAVLLPDERILHQRQNSLSAVEPLRRYYIERIEAVFRYAAGRPTAG
jgi:cell wall-associated NlpC family hydrolase